MAGIEIPARFDRSGYRDLERTAESARYLIGHVCRTIGVPDLGETELLDVGCGTKFTEALLNDDLPIKKYVGVDVYAEMVAFLGQEADDPRFEFFHLDVRNELYNPDAPPMNGQTDLGIGARRFDLIWLFSVFTHLNPQDFRTMLHVLRRYVRPSGTLFFTVFLNERTSTGFGATESMARAIEHALAEGRVAPELRAEWERGSTSGTQGFVDMDPARPLRYAMYSRDYAFELIEGTDWRVVEVLEPNEFAQHQIVCTPVSKR